MKRSVIIMNGVVGAGLTEKIPLKKRQSERARQSPDSGKSVLGRGNSSARW